MVLGERFEMRLETDTLEAIDRWRADQGSMPSRAQAIRHLIAKGLEADRAQPAFQPSGAERVMLAMLADIYQHLDVDREMDPEFIKSAVFGGHDWAMAWKYHNLLHGETVNAAVVEEVARILEMWSILEASFGNLTAKQKGQVAKELGEEKVEVRFDGFDGNNEGDHFTVASFMVQDLKRFDEFSKRDLNAHWPTLDGYRRMLPVYRRLVGHSRLSPSSIAEILDARTHPERRVRKSPAK
jgi:uncharacterized protein YfbU (UPF0304 family)